MALGPVGPVSVYCDWVRWQVLSASPASLCSGTCRCLSSSAPEVHFNTGGTFSFHGNNKKTRTLIIAAAVATTTTTSNSRSSSSSSNNNNINDRKHNNDDDEQQKNPKQQTNKKTQQQQQQNQNKTTTESTPTHCFLLQDRPSTHPSGPPSPSSAAHHTQADLQFWRQRIKEWYPGWQHRAYFVPYVHMHRTHHSHVQVAGQQVTRPLPSVAGTTRDPLPRLLDSDVREDQSLQRVLTCLRALVGARRLVMFALSQMRFEDYLAAPEHQATLTLPRARDLRDKGQDRGDFDVLIISRRHGLLACEVKSVGDAFSPPDLSPPEKDAIVAKKLLRAAGQLRKAVDVLTHLLSDRREPPRVRVSLVLPNVTREQLDRVLAAHPDVSAVSGVLVCGGGFGMWVLGVGVRDLVMGGIEQRSGWS